MGMKWRLTNLVSEAKEYPKFEIVRKPNYKFPQLSSPKLLAKQRQPANVGLYEYQHTELKQKPRLLSSHVLPGVDIRPQLVVESIPGLVIPGTTEKLSPRIRVDYVNKENSSPSKSNLPSVVVSQVATVLGVQAETNDDILSCKSWNK